MDTPNYLSTARSTPVDKSVSRIYSRKMVEQSMLETFQMVGGVNRLAAWANEDANYGKFLDLLIKLAPKEALREMEGVVIEYRSLVPSSPLNTPGVQDGEIVTDAELEP